MIKLSEEYRRLAIRALEWKSEELGSSEIRYWMVDGAITVLLDSEHRLSHRVDLKVLQRVRKIVNRSNSSIQDMEELQSATAMKKPFPLRF